MAQHLQIEVLPTKAEPAYWQCKTAQRHPDGVQTTEMWLTTLDELGNDGWGLVSVADIDGHTYAFLRRD